MLHLVQLDRSYGPETISVMTSAFDMVCKSVSMRMKGSDDVKKTLALIILRHVDRGECNAERLAETAFRESTGADRLTVPRQLGPCPPRPAASPHRPTRSVQYCAHRSWISP